MACQEWEVVNVCRKRHLSSNTAYTYVGVTAHSWAVRLPVRAWVGKRQGPSCWAKWPNMEDRNQQQESHLVLPPSHSTSPPAQERPLVPLRKTNAGKQYSHRSPACIVITGWSLSTGSNGFPPALEMPYGTFCNIGMGSTFVPLVLCQIGLSPKSFWIHLNLLSNKYVSDPHVSILFESVLP